MRELWAELSASMRILRQTAGLSLRKVEAATGRGRGILSQIENAKARPNRDLVEWYDDALGGDGVLMAMYFEARGAHGSHTAARPVGYHVRSGDAVSVIEPLVPSGAAVPAGARDVLAGWTLINTGTVGWTQRRLRRVGAHAAARLIASESSVPVDDCRPGERVRVQASFAAPSVLGTYVAYWQIVDVDGFSCFDPPVIVSVLVVVGT